MSLIDEAAAVPRNNRRCPLWLLTQEHDGLADELAEVMADRRIEGTAIAAALANRYGEEAPSVDAVRTHRRGDCSCD